MSQRLLALALAATCALGAACNTEQPSDEDVAIVNGLCAALDAGSVQEAETAFFDGAHSPLHVLAAAVTEVDRAVAADLLMAKNAVETALTEQVPLPLLRDRLQTLLERTRVTLTTLDRPIPPCSVRSSN